MAEVNLKERAVCALAWQHATFIRAKDQTMTPAEKAANVHAVISMFRDQRGEVQKYAKSLDDQYVLELPPFPSSEYEGPQPPIEVTSPGELNDRLLKALFGKWPPA